MQLGHLVRLRGYRKPAASGALMPDFVAVGLVSYSGTHSAVGLGQRPHEAGLIPSARRWGALVVVDQRRVGKIYALEPLVAKGTRQRIPEAIQTDQAW